jgi:hypothetical protein
MALVVAARLGPPIRSISDGAFRGSVTSSTFIRPLSAGDSRGRWQEQTLVVDTTNFSPRNDLMGSSDQLHLIERFTRVAPDRIDCQITIDDPTTWTKPWTAVIRLQHSDARLYEYACHEGNFEIVRNMLVGSRARN